MKEKDDFALMPRAPSSLEKAEPGAKRLLSSMVADTLALATEEHVAFPAEQYQIGGRRFCAPDYRQVLLWAEETRQTPAKVVELLVYWKSVFRQGHLVEVHWDDCVLRVQRFRFVPGLKIEVFHILGGSRAEGIANRVMEDSSLRPSDFEVLEMNLDGLSQLEVLAVSSQSLKVLDLRPAPKLKRLYCEANYLSQVDLSLCESLEELRLRANCLTELSLLNLPLLRSLECHQNEISFLDLTGTTALEELDCRENQIELLDITPLMNLKSLRYDAGRTQLVQRTDQNF